MNEWLMTSEHSNGRGISAKAVSSRERWQRAKKRRTRGRIREAAMRLFLEHGYDEVTVQRIAAAADVTPITLFRYFPRKEDIVVDIPLPDEPSEAASRRWDKERTRMTASDIADAVVFDVVKRFDDVKYDVLAQRMTIINGTGSLRRALYARIPQWASALAELFPLDDDDEDGLATRLRYGVAVTMLIEVFSEWARCRDHATITDAEILTQIMVETRNVMA